MTAPKHPEITVKLVGGDGNALAMKRGPGHASGQAARRRDQAVPGRGMSGDYEKLLQTCMAWVTVE
jgi:hypothetical protein